MSRSRETAAKLAGNIVETFSARGNVYGDPEDNFANIAAFWNAWLKARYPTVCRDLFLDAIDVAHMSALIKKARLANSPTHEDSVLDDAVYTLLSGGLIPALKPAGSFTKTPFCSAENVKSSCEHEWVYTRTDIRESCKGEDIYTCFKCGVSAYGQHCG